MPIDGRSTSKMLAEAGVKDFAAALDVKQHSHAAKVRWRGKKHPARAEALAGDS